MIMMIPILIFYRQPLKSHGYKPYGVGEPNDGSVEKDDFEASLIYNHALICGAYDRVDLNDLRFNDWHNY